MEPLLALAVKTSIWDEPHAGAARCKATQGWACVWIRPTKEARQHYVVNA